MESREITRDEIVQQLALRIRRYGTHGPNEAAEGRYEQAARWQARAEECWALATALDVYQEVEDLLYLMEEGPE